MSTINTKLLGIDALEPIKNYIDGKCGETRDTVNAELKQHITNELAVAENAIKSEYKHKLEELEAWIDEAEQQGTPEKLHELQLQLSALEGNTQNQLAALNGLERELERLSESHADLYEGITNGTVFNAGQLNEIIKTAMIEEVQINKDSILTPEMYASKIVSLIGNFGQINAANIIGGAIKGHTIESNNTISGTDDPVWSIKDGGEGWLASKAISWDRVGNVTFQPHVKLSWGQVDGKEAGVNAILSTKSYATQEYVNNAVLNVDGTTGAAVEAKINAALDSIKATYATIDDVNSSLEERTEALNTSLVSTINGVDAKYELQSTTLNNALNTAKQDLQTAIANGETETAEKIQNVINELNREISRLDQEFAEVNESLSALNNSINNVKDSVLSDSDINALISTALIDSTSITDDMVSTPNVYTKNIVALIAKFGTVKASNISGDEISGHTVQSSTKITDSEDPMWKICDEGNGYLAGKNISWDRNGNVTLGPDVKISWGQVQEAEQGVLGLLTDNDYATKSDIDTKIIEAGGVTIETVNASIDEKVNAALAAIEETYVTIDDIGTGDDVIEALKNSLGESFAAVDSIQQAKNDLIELMNSKQQYLELAIKTGDDAAANALQLEILKISTEIEKLDTKYKDVPEALQALQNSVGQLETGLGSVLSAEAINNLIKSAFIDATYIDDESVTTPNVFTTRLCALVAKFADIEASRIKGDEITGYTLKSAKNIGNTIDPTWQINNDGSGWLASKAISWDDEGNMSCNVTGAFNGGNDGKCAGGAMEWDSNNVYLNRNLVLGPDVKISFDKISGTENIATKDDVENAGVSEQRVTEITRNTIATSELNADNITSGTISAARINSDDLTVKKLNTTGKSNGKRVEVIDNTVSIYNGLNKISCQLTNSSMGNLNIYDALQNDTLNIAFETTPSIGIYIPSVSYTGKYDISQSCGKQTIGALQSGADITLGGNFSITDFKHPAGILQVSLALEILIYKDDTLVSTLKSNNPSYAINASTGQNFTCSIAETTYTITEAGSYSYEPRITGWYQTVNITGNGNSTYTSQTVTVTGSYTLYDNTVKNSTFIYDDGAIFKNSKGGFAINGEAVAMKCDNAQVVLKDGKIYMAFDGQTTPKEITPRTYKFRLANDKNQTMTVLTFGDVIDGE